MQTETRRFIGNDMARLYDRVKKELGRDAVVLRTRTLARDGGAPLIELVAGPPAPEGERLDVDLQATMLEAVGARLAGTGKMTVPELEAYLAEQGGPTRARRSATLEAPRATEAPHSSPLSEPGDDGVRPLLPGLARIHRDAAAPQQPPASNFPGIRTRQPHEAALVTQLQQAGITAAAVEVLVREALGETNPARAIQRVVDSREVTFPEADTTGIVVVLGAPGSGRTTALMKMALDCADSGRESILVAADSQRMGARQQLHAFAEAAGLDIVDAHDARSVAAIAGRVPRGACLFVDVPSGGFEAPPMPGVVNYAYLAVPAHWQGAALDMAVEACEGAVFDGCVLTFTDLAPSLAPAISMVVDSPLGIAFASNGRDVADGMGTLDVYELVSGLFPLLTGESTNAKLVATA